jgi:glycosyltransferase involved in cell wall biosynthesis
LPEAVGDAGLMVRANDVDALYEAIGRLLGDAELRSDLRRRGLERASQFSWRASAEQMLAIYRRLAITR